MSWEIIVDPDAQKQLKRVSRRDAERIGAILREFAANPYVGDIRKMEGEEDVWRRRIGAYRILYEVRVKARVIYIFDVLRRTSSSY